MRKTVAIAAATGALFFGGAGVSHATVSAPAPSSTTTILAQEDPNDRGGDKTGLWGLLGLLGLGGLMGVNRRNGHSYRDTRTTGTTGTTGTGRI